MALFEDVFNPNNIYGILFLNVKGVLIYPNLKELEENNKVLFNQWKNIAKIKHNEAMNLTDYCYETYAVHYPEFTKIIAITYATMSIENGEPKRDIRKVYNHDENLVVSTFMDELYLLSSAATKTTPHRYPPFCGHNIIAYDIPFLIKRFILLNFNTGKKLPAILKNCMNIKPWESGMIDVMNVWKFNGFDNISLQLISDFLSLKKTVDLLYPNELSQYYWNRVNDNPKETLEFMALQSATQMNLVMQFMNKIRTF